MMKRVVLVLCSLTALLSCGSKIEMRTGEDTGSSAFGVIKYVSLFNKDMNRTLKTTVWLPAEYDESRSYPFLYLLHGYGDDNDSWIQKGRAYSIANKYLDGGGVPMVIVMPDGLTEFYQGRYETYMHEELMPMVESKFHCNGKRAVTGLSMGGYGTLYHALKYPDKFTYAYAMSPAADLNAFRILATAHDPSEYPPFTVESGTQDYTVGIEGVRELADMLISCGLRCEFIERPGGHDWNFWPVCLEKALVKVGKSFE